MYSENNPIDQKKLENLKILRMIRHSPEEACQDDPAVQEAFEESLRDLAEDIIEYSPGLAHILLGMSAAQDPDSAFYGQN